jgi:tetraacyldisaccharide 4'-kinase
MQPIDFRIYSNGLNLYPFQELFFTTFDYDKLSPVFPELHPEVVSINDLRKKHLFLVTGIASPEPLVRKLEYKTYNLYTMFFSDHHNFTRKDIQSIENMVNSVEDENKIIVTTEKDAVRFRDLAYLPENIKNIMYYLPVRVTFLNNKERITFNKKIVEHVRNYKTNSRLS